jgi:hypothetical protein
MPLSSKFILISLTLSLGVDYRIFGQVAKEYDRPEIKYYLRDTILNVAINTDLPANIIVSVSISRSFWKKESETEYAIEYFSRVGTVGEWEVVKEILIDESKWRSDLDEQLQSPGRAGLGASVGKISDTIRISVVVPYTNNPYPKFRKAGRSERLIFAPSRYSTEMVQEYANPESLAVGRSYALSRVTPLMPELQPADPMLALKKRLELPIESTITILSVSKSGGRSWYQVTAKDKVGRLIGTGWVNSAALVGQEVTVAK